MPRFKEITSLKLLSTAVSPKTVNRSNSRARNTLQSLNTQNINSLYQDTRQRKLFLDEFSWVDSGIIWRTVTGLFHACPWDRGESCRLSREASWGARWGGGLGCLSEGVKISDFYSHCLLFQPFLVFAIRVLWEGVRIQSCVLGQLQISRRAQARGARGAGCRGGPGDGPTVLAALFL